VTKYLILAAALAGCSTFKDPAATPFEVASCQKFAHNDAHDNTSWGDVLLLGAPIAHRLKARESFEKCMADKGYRTSAQGNSKV